MLGQKGDPLLSGHYDNNEVPVIKKQVDEAHEATLEAFDFDNTEVSFLTSRVRMDRNEK